MSAGANAVDAIQHELTVCVVFRGRGEPLQRLLDALAKQSALPGSFDVVVVDASRGGMTAEPPARPKVTVVADESDNRQRLLNRVWRESTAPYVAFLAADAEPSELWVEAMTRALRRGRRVVSGTWRPHHDSLHNAGTASYRLWTSARDLALVSADQLGCLRSDLEEVGGWDETLDDSSADIDLAARLVDAGADPFLARHAMALSDVEPTDLPTMLTLHRNALPALRVLSDHPRARARLLVGGVGWQLRHVEVLVAAAGLLMARRDRRALLLASPWVHERTCLAPATGGPRRKWFILPGVFAFDLWNAVAILRARLTGSQQ